MADCELIAACIFFNDKMKTLVSTAQLMKTRYCRGEKSECARYVVFKALGRPAVPQDLYPNDLARGKKIVTEAGK